MNITDELTTYLEKLARIELSATERDKCRVDLQNIVSHMDVLNELEVSDGELDENLIAVKNVLRDDEVKPSLDRDDVFKNASQVRDGYFSVPKTVD